MQFKFKNYIFFTTYLFLNPRYLPLILSNIYLPIYIQLEWLKQFKFDTIIDIGAHKGHVSHALSNLFPAAKIYAFDPIPENCNSIKTLIDSTNLIVDQCALGSKIGDMTFYINSDTALSSLLSLKKDQKKYRSQKITKKITTKVKTLDSYFNNKHNLGNILLKIDTQGNEYSVLEGGGKFLDNVSLIHIETSFEELYEKQKLFDDIYIILKKHGFIYIGENKDSFFYPIFKPDNQVNSIFINPKYLNYSYN